MIVDIKVVHENLGNIVRFKEKLMIEVESFQHKGYRVEIQYGSEYKALVIARECNWIGNNS